MSLTQTSAGIEDLKTRFNSEGRIRDYGHLFPWTVSGSEPIVGDEHCEVLFGHMTVKSIMLVTEPETMHAF